MSLAPEGARAADAMASTDAVDPGLPDGTSVPEIDPARLRAVLDGTAEAVVLTDQARTVHWWNVAAQDSLPALSVGAPLNFGGRAAVPEPDGGSAHRVDLGGRHFEVRGRHVGDGWLAWYLRDVTAQQTRENSLLAERSRQALLAKAGRFFVATLNVERLLRTAFDLLAEFGVARSAVAFSQGDHDFLLTSLDGGRSHRRSPNPVRTMRGNHRAVGLSGHDRASVPVPGWEGPVDTFELRTYGAPFGMLIAEVSDVADHDLLISFAEQLAGSLQAAVLHQQRGSHTDTLRDSLTQRDLPAIDGAGLAAAFRPAVERDRIGGDFYEVTATAEGWSFTLGDVCGKGVEAAVLSGQARHVLHTASLLGLGPAARLDLLNGVIRSESTRRFVTLVTGDLRVRADGCLLIRLANGGHPRPVVLGGSREPAEITEHGVLVGALAQARFADTEVVLAPGETMVLYTDGVTEARNPAGEFYGTERLLRLLRDCRGLPAAATTAYVEHDVFDFLRGAGHDDVAVLAIQATGPHAPDEEVHG